MRRRRFRAWVVAAVGAGAIVLGLETGLAAGAIHLPSVSTSSGVGTKVQPPDPEAGLTDAQRTALHSRVQADWEARYTAWLRGLNVASLDLHSLPRFALMGGSIPGPPTLLAATQRATLIVTGTVSTIKPTPFSGTDTAFTVDRTIKGPAAASVILNQEGGLRPTPDWSSVTIADAPDLPLLLPGDRAVLLLQTDSSGRYYIQGITGGYQVIGGYVHGSSMSEFAVSITGEAEATFVQQLQSLVP